MAAQQPPQQQQVPFALAPALVNNDVINYTTPDGIKLYKNATAPLPIECDCTSERLKVFLSSLADRSSANGWDNIMDIPPVPNPNNITHNLLTEYGQVTITQCQAHAQTYVNAQNRDAQNSFNLYQCLMASLTDVARTRVMLLEDQYTVTGVRSVPGVDRGHPCVTSRRGKSIWSERYVSFNQWPRPLPINAISFLLLSKCDLIPTLVLSRWTIALATVYLTGSRTLLVHCAQLVELSRVLEAI